MSKRKFGEGPTGLKSSKSLNGNSSEIILQNPTENTHFKDADVGTLIGLVQTLEKAELKNAQMRTKYLDSPQKFMQSEIDLAEAIKALNEITVVPNLYTKVVQLKFPQIAFKLLLHENTDIVVEIINLVNDLVDPQNLLEDKDAFILIEALKENRVFEMVVKNLERLAESEEDAEGLFNALGIFENLMEIELRTLLILLAKTDLIKILISLTAKCNLKDKRNKFYSAELISNFVNLSSDICPILLKNDFLNSLEKAFEESCLETRAVSNDESEFLNNMLNILTIVVIAIETPLEITTAMTQRILTIFRKPKYQCRLSSINALSALMIASEKNCVKFIEEKGLKFLFSEFVKKIRNLDNRQCLGAAIKQTECEFLEQLIVILLQFFMKLKDVSYMRFLNKFIEKDYEKIDLAVQLFDDVLALLEATDKRLKSEESTKNIPERKVYLYKHKKGGYLLSLTAALIGFLVSSGKKEIKERAVQVISQRDTSLEEVRVVLSDLRNHIEDESNDVKPIPKEVLERIISLCDEQ